MLRREKIVSYFENMFQDFLQHEPAPTYDLERRMCVLVLRYNMEIQELLTGKPFLSNDQAIELVEERYNLKVKKLKTLDGYDNQNFLVEGTLAGSGNDTDEKIERFCLKITNSELSKEFEGLTDATYMMHYLRNQGFTCPQPLADKDGNLCKLVTFTNFGLKESGGNAPVNKRPEDTFMVRILRFLPGKTLKDVIHVPDNVCEEMGETLARMHVALQGMKLDPKPLLRWGEHSAWSLNLLYKLKDSISIVEDPGRNQMVREILNDFQSRVIQKKAELPQGFLHGDFNDVNVLVDQSADSGELHMTGFIDFDDAYYGPIVFDLGISIMYVLQSKTSCRDAAAAAFLRGYVRHRPLNELERSCVYFCTAARFAQSLVLGLVSYSSTKNEYVLGTQVRGWEALQEMWDRGQKVTYQKWQFS